MNEEVSRLGDVCLDRGAEAVARNKSGCGALAFDEGDLFRVGEIRHENCRGHPSRTCCARNRPAVVPGGVGHARSDRTLALGLAEGCKCPAVLKGARELKIFEFEGDVDVTERKLDNRGATDIASEQTSGGPNLLGDFRDNQRDCFWRHGSGCLAFAILVFVPSTTNLQVQSGLSEIAGYPRVFDPTPGVCSLVALNDFGHRATHVGCHLYPVA